MCRIDGEGRREGRCLAVESIRSRAIGKERGDEESEGVVQRERGLNERQVCRGS